MILIVSEEQDISTFKVCDWLERTNKPYTIVNENSTIIVEKVEINQSYFDITLSIDADCFKLNDIETIWFRRGGVRLFCNDISTSLPRSIKVGLRNFMQQELFIIRETLYLEFRRKRCFGNLGNTNKLEILNIAKSVGLNIPDTLITMDKSDLISFQNKHPRIISKAISENVHFSDSNYHFFYPNAIVEKVHLKEIPNRFQPTLFQQYIDKLFEVRIFIFSGKLFAGAIFSQSNDKTKVDYRNYDASNPNRLVPFSIPKSLKTKLIKLMKVARLNSGSVDLIYNERNEFIFLEINPVGQFGNLSHECNYNIEEFIASKL
jgi:ATP-GRASP peptide maturase of grasp-with-spasm system